MTVSFNRHFAISAAVRLNETQLAMDLIGFSSHPRLLLLYRAIPMDKVVELVNQLTSFQCANEQLG